MADPLNVPAAQTEDQAALDEFSVTSHGWWTASRPYRVMLELVVYSFLAMSLLAYVISRAADTTDYRVFDIIQPIYVVGILSGALGGAARGLLSFWKRDGFNMLKRDYWRHCMPFYLGTTFGFLATLILQSGLKVIGVEHDISDSGGMSFVATICMLFGFFAESAEQRLGPIFDGAFGARSDGS